MENGLTPPAGQDGGLDGDTRPSQPGPRPLDVGRARPRDHERPRAGPTKRCVGGRAEPATSVAGLENYRLYLDAENSSAGGDGHITTIEPLEVEEELSALSGIEFRSSEMISDLTLYGEGSDNDQIQLTIYMRFRGQQGLNRRRRVLAEGRRFADRSETIDLDDPRSSTFQQNCAWTSSEVFFDVSSNGVTVPNGKSLNSSSTVRRPAKAKVAGTPSVAATIATSKLRSASRLHRRYLPPRSDGQRALRVLGQGPHARLRLGRPRDPHVGAQRAGRKP